MSPTHIPPSQAAVATPQRSAWCEPARLFLAGFGGILVAAIFSFLLTEEEAVKWAWFLRGQVGFEFVGTLWFWKLATGFALGAAAGYFAFLEIPEFHWQKANRVALGLALFWVPVLVYIPAMSAGFIWDDDQEITANSALMHQYNPAAPAGERFQTNWKGLWEIWTGGITSDKDSDEGRRELGRSPAPWLLKTLRVPLRAMERQLFGGSDKEHYPFRCNQFADYFPLKTTMLWVEYQLWGYDFGPNGMPVPNPHPFHVMNILVHALDGVLLWLLLRQLGVPGAWLGALLFALHPVHAESVAWIAERKNTLSLFFCLLSASAWLKFEGSGKRGFYIGSLLLFVGSLLCKTHVVVFPAVLLLMAWWRHGRLTLRDVVRSIPFFAVAFALAGVTIWFQNDRAIGGEVIPIGDWPSRIAGAGVVTWSYLSKAILPINLNTIYANTAWLWWPLTEPQMWMYLAGALVPMTLLLMLAIQELYPLRNPIATRTPFFVFAFFVGNLFPVLGFFTMSYMRLTLQADHFQYFSDIAIVALEGAIIATLFQKASAAWRPVVVTSAVALVFVFGSYTWERAGVHQSEFTLWDACLKKNEASWQAHNHMGADLYRQRKLKEAAPHFARAVELKPENPEVHNNLGLVLWYYFHNYDAAIAQYREAVRIKGEVIELRRNLAGALMARGLLEEAAEQYRIMIKDAPNDSDSHGALGAALANLGRFAEAKAEMETALRINPGNGPARQNYEALIRAGK
ncbi:MAG: tetratricopeptide repeat protein [Chthoniobacteraceae bacterium]|nr:tetratricopeptide repeat protein [Chthoniobacteraceae bacterium]